LRSACAERATPAGRLSACSWARPTTHSSRERDGQAPPTQPRTRASCALSCHRRRLHPRPQPSSRDACRPDFSFRFRCGTRKRGHSVRIAAHAGVRRAHRRRFGLAVVGLREQRESEARRDPRREEFCPPRYPGCAGDVFASACLRWAWATWQSAEREMRGPGGDGTCVVEWWSWAMVDSD
jgi:hypothetical protein